MEEGWWEVIWEACGVLAVGRVMKVDGRLTTLGKGWETVRHVD